MKYVQLPNGMTVRDVSSRGALAVYDEIFHRNCYGQFGIEIRDGDVIVDLGANIGLFCLWLGRIRAKVEDGETVISILDATVHALEPIRETFLSLVENLNTNVRRLRVRPWNAAVGFGYGETGLADFRTCPRLSQVASMFPWSKEKETANRAYIVEKMNRWPWAAVSWMVPGRVKTWIAERVRRWYMRHETERCQVWSFAEMVRNLNLSRIDLLKIDVEGAELGIFDGMTDEHFAMVRQLVVEVHDYDDLGPIEVMLEHRGFAVHTELFPPPGLAMVYAVKHGASHGIRATEMQTVQA